MYCRHTLTTLTTNLTSDVRVSACGISTLIDFPCVLFVSPRFLTNSLVLTVREPNETQSLFLLYHQRNEEEIMTYSCVEISVMHIVNSQNSRNSLHIIIAQNRYWNTHITCNRESVFFFPTKNTPSRMKPLEKRSTACQNSWVRFQRWRHLCGWQCAAQNNIWIKALNALHPRRLTTEEESPVYLTNRIYRDWDRVEMDIKTF